MPEVTTISVTEAQIRTIPGRQGRFINEYADYIQQVPTGQAGKLTIGQSEKHPTVRRRLVSAANALNITLIIKRSGNDLYFWREDGGEEQTRPRRGRRPRTGSPGGLLPPTMPFNESEVGEQGVVAEETTPMDQSFVEIE